LGVGWGFESGFSGFSGFFSVRCCLGWCVLQLMNHFLSTIFFILYPFKLWDNRVLSCSLVLNPDPKPMRQYPSTNKLYTQTSDIIINQKNHKNPGSNYYCRKTSK
jgi:hypothetical protein